MTIRYLAEELYRWTREVESLQKTLAALSPTVALEERNRLEGALRQAQHQPFFIFRCVREEIIVRIRGRTHRCAPTYIWFLLSATR